MSTFSNFTGNIKIGASVGFEGDNLPVTDGWTLTGGVLYKKTIYTVPANQFVKCEISLVGLGVLFSTIFSDSHFVNAFTVFNSGSPGFQGAKSLSNNWIDNSRTFNHEKEIILPSGTTLNLFANSNSRVIFGMYGQLYYNG